MYYSSQLAEFAIDTGRQQPTMFLTRQFAQNATNMASVSFLLKIRTNRVVAAATAAAAAASGGGGGRGKRRG